VNSPLSSQQLDYRELVLDEVAAAVEGMLCTHADRVLVTSAALADHARARGASRRRVRLVRCGAPRELFALPRRPSRGGEHEEFVLGFVGSLKPWHGIEILLHVFLRLREISPAYRLLVVGDGPMMPQVREFCRAHSLEAFVELPGRVAHEEMPHWLGRMDAGLAPYPDLPSFYFSPLKIWEYAAAGVPIVASASGELPQLFPHKRAALLHPPGKIHKILKHVETLRRSPDLGPRLARRARRTAREYTWDRLAARVETIATRALAEGAGRTDPGPGRRESR
jgi:glycosyltransferase involved in cell wall biosynthesis